MVGPEGLEPSHLAIQEPKSCVSTSFTTSPGIVRKCTIKLFKKPLLSGKKYQT